MGNNMRGHNMKRTAANVLWALPVFALTVLMVLACDDRDPNAVPQNLEEAVRWGTIEDVRIQVANGADVNGKDYSGNPILLAAVSRHVPTFGISILGGQPVRYDVEPLRILVDAGADVNARDSDNDPMLYSAILEDVEAVRILVDAGADVNARDSDGDPVLKEAIWRSKTDALHILIDAGADVNARDADGDPLLMEAVWREELDALHILIDAGADVNAKDSRGWSMLREARFRGHSEIEEILLAAGAVLSKREKQDCESRDRDIAQALVRKVIPTEHPIHNDPRGLEAICPPD